MRAAVYLDPVLHTGLRLKAIETTPSISQLVKDAIRESHAEEFEDIAAFEMRAKVLLTNPAERRCDFLWTISGFALPEPETPTSLPG